jgi:sigma-E factor negative regulatory protein RseC
MTEIAGRVVNVKGDLALVEVGPRQVGCGRCQEAGGCGALPGGGEGAKRIYHIRNDIAARTGDEVVLVVPEGALLKVSLLAYLVPVLLVIPAAAIGAAISETTAVIAALAGLVGGMMLLRLAQRRMLSSREPLLSMRIKDCAFHSSKGIHTC